MGSEKTSQRRGGQPSWVLQNKGAFARGRTLQAGGAALWGLGVRKSSVLLWCKTGTEDEGRYTGEACVGAWTRWGKSLKHFR